MEDDDREPTLPLPVLVAFRPTSPPLMAADTTAEGNETAVLMANADYTVDSPNHATVTIADNDQPPTLPTVTVVDSDGNAAESGANSGSFRITRSGSTVSALPVRYSLGGSAGAQDAGALVGRLQNY